ncbi:hypothetical protein BO226_12210 [Rhodococcus sp. 2G]|nr:hypothetical protein BO226_12210 [Rhodococcus sp. 2G]
MHHATFATPDLTVFCHLDELGLVAVGQLLEPDRAVIECRVAEPDPWCRGCGSRALSRGTDTRRLAHETSSRSSTGPARATARPGPSTGAWSASAARP